MSQRINAYTRQGVFEMTEEEKKDEKKVIIDEDWKQQAQKEKEILAKQEEAEEEKAGDKKARRGPLPKGDFAALVSMLVTQALFSLGLLEVEGQKKEPDLELAKYNIDMLETIEEKTRGNLTEEEEKVLENMLSQIRMGYVKAAE
ncbi:MAG TPA: DUF1844 domain-containing protein [Phycisphaerales bacterium]|nr:DUF1844 domain-containing protein [Phycisphaerales bacterium]